MISLSNCLFHSEMSLEYFGNYIHTYVYLTTDLKLMFDVNLKVLFSIESTLCTWIVSRRIQRQNVRFLDFSFFAVKIVE